MLIVAAPSYGANNVAEELISAYVIVVVGTC